MRPAALFAALALLAAPATAEAPPDAATLGAEGEDIPLAEWRALTAGRTVWYHIEGEIWGRESYLPGTDRATFQFADGQCLDARWSYEAPWFCFDFGAVLDDPVQCFRHLRWKGGMWVLGDAGGVQKVDRIDGAPLSCGPNVGS